MLGRLFARLDWRYSALIVFGAAVLAYSWSVALHFQFDDYWLIPSAGYQLRELGGVLGHPVGLVTGTERHLPFLLQHLFQPVVWLMLVIEKWISGEPLSPFVFHASSILVHAVTAVALLRLFRVWLDLPSAMVGALFFAVDPAASQAVSWTAARGDLLVTLFCVLALDSIVRAREKPVWAAGLYLALGLLSKPTLLSMLPLHVAALVLVLRDRGWKVVAKNLLVLLVPLAVVWVVRSRYLGTWAMVYVGGIKPSLSQVPIMIDRFWDFVRACLVPWNASAEARPFAPLFAAVGQVVVLLLWLALPVLALVRDFKGVAPKLAIGLGISALLAGPALLLWALYPAASGTFMNRSLYPVIAALAWLVAVVSRPAVAAVSKPSGLERALAGVLVLVFAASVDSLVHVARTEIAASSVTSARIASLEAASKRAGPDTALVVNDTHVGFAGIMLTFSQIRTAMAPPFHEPRVDVHYAPDLPAFVRSDQWFGGIAGPVQILKWTGSEYVPVSKRIAGITRPLPELVPAGNSTWKPATSVAPRSFRGIRIAAKAPVPSGSHLIIKSTKTEVRRPIAIAAGQSTVVGLDDDVDWLTSQELVSVAIEPPVADARITLVESLPKLAVLAPKPQSELPMLETPEITVAKLAGVKRLRFRFELVVFGSQYRMTYEVAVAALPSTPDTWRYRAARPELADANKTLVSWDTLPRWYTGVIAKAGVRRIPVVCEVEASNAAGVVARAEPVGFFLVAK